MKMTKTMLTFAPLCLLCCWMVPISSMKISIFISKDLKHQNQDIPLSIVEDAVDDMYIGCHELMAKEIKENFFDNEMNGIFGAVWKNAEKCVARGLKIRQKDKEDAALTTDHIRAICVYTSDFKQFYDTFNTAVRTNRKYYGTSFPFHSIHFWLTSAIQILNNNKKCYDTYRRTKSAFTGKVNQVIRFGSFTSTSKKTNLTKFGKKTCFKIKTCSGAFLKKYPHLGDHEQEVLIPPYEMFKITLIEKKASDERLADCEVVYFLESAGNLSNLNCHIAKE